MNDQEQTGMSDNVTPEAVKAMSLSSANIDEAARLAKAEAPAPKKVFTRNDIKRTITLPLVFPKIYPDYEPWVFTMRLKLSRDAEEQRQQYLGLSAAKATEQMGSQALNEVCDLLTELPTGFGDLVDTGRGPGFSFRSYVESATDPDMKEFLGMLVEAADSAYWGAITPREFRPTV